MDDGQASLLWRWEVKKPSCLGEHKTAALEVRSWLKKVPLCFLCLLVVLEVATLVSAWTPFCACRLRHTWLRTIRQSSCSEARHIQPCSSGRKLRIKRRWRMNIRAPLQLQLKQPQVLCLMMICRCILRSDSGMLACKQFSFFATRCLSL